MKTLEDYKAEVARLKAIIAKSSDANEWRRAAATKRLMAIRDQMLNLLETAR